MISTIRSVKAAIKYLDKKDELALVRPIIVVAGIRLYIHNNLQKIKAKRLENFFNKYYLVKGVYNGRKRHT